LESTLFQLGFLLLRSELQYLFRSQSYCGAEHHVKISFGIIIVCFCYCCNMSHSFRLIFRLLLFNNDCITLICLNCLLFNDFRVLLHFLNQVFDFMLLFFLKYVNVLLYYYLEILIVLWCLEDLVLQWLHFFHLIKSIPVFDSNDHFNFVMCAKLFVCFVDSWKFLWEYLWCFMVGRFRLLLQFLEYSFLFHALHRINF
jgi:hypothetical protein